MSDPLTLQRSPFTAPIHHTEVVLSPRISLLCQRLPKPKGFFVIARIVSGNSIPHIP
jgi:hypothetical protein